MKAILTVIAKDQVGIIAKVSSLLAEQNINILDISQTVLQEYFTMMMLVDTDKCKTPFVELSSLLKSKGEEWGLDIRIQREDIFNAMHRI
jgi:ACT domain-containing protein